jgi:DNA invertase Pin-like site-specific DNA recombinase
MKAPTIHAAIYARKSTAQKGVTDEQKSVTVQLDDARAHAAKMGWRVVAEFSDDGLSGTEWKRRKDLQRMLAMALQPNPPFTKVVVSEQKTLGRETIKTMALIQQLDEAGVQVVEVMTGGHELALRTPTEKLLTFVQGHSDEDHARKTSERTKAALTRRVLRGQVAGCRVYGYVNEDVFDGVDVHGRPRKSHVRRRVDPVEAAVVRRIFQLYASGTGGKRIAKTLNREEAPPPKPFIRKDPTTVRPPAWNPSTIRTILGRDLYRGVVVWNRSKKRNAHLRVDPQPRPESEWIRLPVNESLRIVSDDLWARVQSRREDTAGKTLRFADGRMSGRPPKTPTKNMLAGMATCGACGGSIIVETSPRKRGRVPEYVCHRHRHYGACANALHMPVRTVNEAVLQGIEAHALTPEVIERVIALTERTDTAEHQDALTGELKDLEKRIARVTQVLEISGDLTTLTARLRELDARRTTVRAMLAGLCPVPRLAPNVVEDRLAEWRRMLRGNTTQARAVLQRILCGRMVFTPCGDGYTFEAPTRFDKLFSGIVAPMPAFLKPLLGRRDGLEHIRAKQNNTRPEEEDTLDGDYARLLERATARLTREANEAIAAHKGRGKRRQPRSESGPGRDAPARRLHTVGFRRLRHRLVHEG